MTSSRLGLVHARINLLFITILAKKITLRRWGVTKDDHFDKQLVDAKSTSLCRIIQESLEKWVSFIICRICCTLVFFSRILIAKTQTCHLRPKSFISLYCLRAVKSRNQIELIWLISAQDKMLKSLNHSTLAVISAHSCTSYLLSQNVS